MNFANRLLTTLATILGLSRHEAAIPPQGVAPVPLTQGRSAVRYQTRGGVWRRRGLYVLPRLPNGETYRTPDRRATSPEIVDMIKADALIRRMRRISRRGQIVDRTLQGFQHSPGLLTVSERLDRQARRAERKALTRGEIE